MRELEEQSENRQDGNEQPSISKPARDFTSIIPDISLPKSGGAIQSIGEKFSLNPATGSGNISVPIAMAAGRGAPQLALTYDSGVGNGPFGLGWSLGLAKITRKTEKRLPNYSDEDVFILTGSEDLVPVERTDDGTTKITTYQPRTEGGFAWIRRYETAQGSWWLTISKENIRRWYGAYPNATGQVSDPDLMAQIVNPDRPEHVYSWLLAEERDDRGNRTRYSYLSENDEAIDSLDKAETNREGLLAQKYIGQIDYGIGPDSNADSSEFIFKLIFDYKRDLDNQVWAKRLDPFSNYRPGFDLRTRRLCYRVQQLNLMPDISESGHVLNMETIIDYDEDPIATTVKSITHRRYESGNDAQFSADFPAVTFQYIESQPDERIRYVDPDQVRGTPVGLSGYDRFIDLEGEALSGILSEQSGNWYYRRNTGSGTFDPPQSLSKPAGWTSLRNGGQITTLENDGAPYLVSYGNLAGYAEREFESGWSEFRPFPKAANIDFNDRNIRWLDLNGDGKPEVCLLHDEVLRWQENEGAEGFGQTFYQSLGKDNNAGPAKLFANGLESIFTTDMSGDGLSDIVRIRNGEVSYWPNLGYGRFGHKVTMGHAPLFTRDNDFDPARLKLGDIDGSGTTDLLYLGAHETAYWLNASGNSFSAKRLFQSVPPMDNLVSVGLVDLLGNGTSCLVWSSASPADQATPWRYIALMTHRDLAQVELSEVNPSNLPPDDETRLNSLLADIPSSSDNRADLTDLADEDIHFLEHCGAVVTRPAKPYLLNQIDNNMGMQTRLSYKPSTYFYLKDRTAGTPWITRLPFPVHVVDRKEVIDFVSDNRFVSRFSFHHGYYDRAEREFRGFARVDQWDMEGTNLSGDKVFDRTAVMTRNWVHTGAFIGEKEFATELAKEYYPAQFSLPPSVIDPNSDHTAKDIRQAKRILRGQPLRSEVYACEPLEPGQYKPIITGHPYQIVENRFCVKTVQLCDDNEFGIYFSVPEESLTRFFETEPSDPRIAHELTLKSDEYGQILQSASIAYGREPSKSKGLEQERTHLLVSENTLINAGRMPADWHRLGVPQSSQSWEVGHNIDLFTNGLARPDEIRGFFPDNGPKETDKYKPLSQGKSRLLSAAVQLYRRNTDLTLSAQPLDLGEIESMALPCRSYALVYSLQDVAEADGKFTDQDFFDSHYLDPLQDSDHAGLTKFLDYITQLPTSQSGRAGWWARDNETELSASDFYAPVRVRNSWGSESSIEMDSLSLTAIKVTQHMPSGPDLTTTSEIDYRIMAPKKVTDSNGNMQAARFDTLGRVNQTAIIGKNGEGDQLDNITTFAPTSTATSLVAYSFYDPVSNTPSWVHTWSRETHEANVAAGDHSRWIEARLYSDGFGREALSKAKAAPDPDNGADRWLTSAKTVYDNKGNPVMQYEPYFTGTVEYGDGAQNHGVTPVLYYDAMDRVTATELPDGTKTRVEFNPWEQHSWDPQDCFGEPLKRTDIQPWSGSVAPGHVGTPSKQFLDSLGRTFKTEVSNFIPGNSPITKTYISFVETDISGNVLKTTDAKGQTALAECFDRAGRPIKSISNDAGTSYGLPAMDGQPRIGHLSNGHRVEQDYDDLRRPTNLWVTTPNGDHYVREAIVYNENAPSPLINGAGQVWRVFDPCGMMETFGYDFKGVPLSTTRHVLGKFTNAAGPDDYTSWDQHDLMSDLPLFSESFTTTASMDALGRPVTAMAPDGSVQSFGYDQGGGLIKVELEGYPTGSSAQTIVGHAQYDSKGRREKIVYGNGTRTEYEYDEDSFRLKSLKTLRGAAVLQHLTYVYDPLGNIIQIEDLAGDAVLPGYQTVPPIKTYTYDSISRLIEATGREHVAQIGKGHHEGPDGLRGPDTKDMSKISPYTERWAFDDIGNITRWDHIGAQNWHRVYDYLSAGNNQLSRTTVNPNGQQPFTTSYTYDAAGNIIDYGDIGATDRRINSSVWNVDDQPETMMLHGNRTARYRYDASGERMVKRVETSGGYSVRLYLGGYEIFRDYKTDGSFNSRRDSLHLMDGESRILLIETDKPADDISLVGTVTPRWQYVDHLGTAALEMDGAGQIISMEEFNSYGTTAWHWKNSGLSQKRYRYTGMERDQESGLQYHSARYYMPWLGRWISTDPLGIVDGASLWVYVRGNPVFNKDINGLQSSSKIEDDVKENPPLDFMGSLGNEISFEDFVSSMQGPYSMEYLADVWQNDRNVRLEEEYSMGMSWITSPLTGFSSAAYFESFKRVAYVGEVAVSSNYFKSEFLLRQLEGASLEELTGLFEESVENRNNLRKVFQSKTSKFGQAVSDLSMKPNRSASYFFEKNIQAGFEFVDDIDVLKFTDETGPMVSTLSKGSSTRGWIKYSAKFTKFAGPLAIGVDIGLGAYRYSEAPEEKKSEVAAEETGRVAGGALGGYLGGLAGGAIVTGLALSGPVGWIVLGVFLVGGAIAGSYAGAKTGKAIHNSDANYTPTPQGQRLLWQ